MSEATPLKGRHLKLRITGMGYKVAQFYLVVNRTPSRAPER
jgi:hypothetical protein